MRVTLFDQVFPSLFFRSLTWLILKLSGWKVVGKKPTEKKAVLVAAPHTSNWDFVLMLLAAFHLRLKLFWMVKDNVYKAGLGPLANWAGWIPVDRGAPHGVVAQVINAFATSEEFLLLNTPEGTRSKRDRWKTGFYHIALKAQVPLLLCFVDAPQKIIGLGPLFWPTGDLEKDFKELDEFYKDKRGIRPELYTPPLGE